jgi:hypothetical protein
MPTYPTAYGAFCEPCEWVGPGRSDNLRALRDYDAHLLTKGHAEAHKPGTPEPGDVILATDIEVEDIIIVALDGDGYAPGTYAVLDRNDERWDVKPAREPHRWIAV